MCVLTYFITSDVSFEAERGRWPELLLQLKTRDLGDREVIFVKPCIIHRSSSKITGTRLCETPKLLICFKE